MQKIVVGALRFCENGFETITDCNASFGRFFTSPGGFSLSRDIIPVRAPLPGRVPGKAYRGVSRAAPCLRRASNA